ncbi:MAG: 50S ribosomal protein L14e [Promethearchaeota archaeon]
MGRICVKTRGRETGRYCVVVEIIDKNYLLIDGLKIRRRRVNYNHVEPIPEMIQIERGASHEEVEDAIKKARKTRRMNQIVSIPLK